MHSFLFQEYTETKPFFEIIEGNYYFLVVLDTSLVANRSWPQVTNLINIPGLYY